MTDQQVHSHNRRHLRVSHSGEAWIAWGYERQRCNVVNFSQGGLSVAGLKAHKGTPVSIELDLPDGRFTLCGVVVHRQTDEVVGIRYLDLTAGQQVDLEAYLWDLLAAAALPSNPKLCSAPGCDRPRKARGLCSRHYNRWWRENKR